MGRLTEAFGEGNRKLGYLDKSNGFVQIQSNEVDNVLDKLDDEDLMKEALFKALKSGGHVLQDETKKYFRNAMGESATHYSKYIKSAFEDGIVMKGDKAYCEVRVSIMKDFRMKFFEKGTVDRYTQNYSHSDYKRKRVNENTGKSNYRGKITDKHFFKDARANSGELVNNAIQQSLNNTIEKVLRE